MISGHYGFGLLLLLLCHGCYSIKQDGPICRRETNATISRPVATVASTQSFAEVTEIPPFVEAECPFRPAISQVPFGWRRRRPCPRCLALHSPRNEHLCLCAIGRRLSSCVWTLKERNRGCDTFFCDARKGRICDQKFRRLPDGRAITGSRIDSSDAEKS